MAFQDGGEIGGSRVHFPSMPVKYLADLRSRVNRQQFIGETHRILECTQAHPPGNQHQKGPICLWVAGEMTESHPRA